MKSAFAFRQKFGVVMFEQKQNKTRTNVMRRTIFGARTHETTFRDTPSTSSVRVVRAFQARAMSPAEIHESWTLIQAACTCACAAVLPPAALFLAVFCASRTALSSSRYCASSGGVNTPVSSWWGGAKKKRRALSAQPHVGPTKYTHQNDGMLPVAMAVPMQKFHVKPARVCTGCAGAHTHGVTHRGLGRQGNIRAGKRRCNSRLPPAHTRALRTNGVARSGRHGGGSVQDQAQDDADEDGSHNWAVCLGWCKCR